MMGMKKEMMVCTLGGGSGMPIVNKALVRSGVKKIKSIVTTFDSGGDSGRMRTDERGKILAFSDYWRSLISLWDDGKQKAIWEEMLRYRDGRGRNFGNIFFQFMSEKSGNLSGVDSLFEKLTGARLIGSVIPVSLSPAEVCFRTKSGKSYKGEHRLDDLRMSLDKVEDIWLMPKVRANKEAVENIFKADYIIICPGSMYGSVITNLLPIGVIEAYNKSKAKKILMTNIMSVANENDKYTQDDYVKIFSRFLKTERPFDLILMADLKNLNKMELNKLLKSYRMEHSEPIKFKNGSKIKTLVEDIALIDKVNLRLRHGEEKLAKVFVKIFKSYVSEKEKIRKKNQKN
ncbi:MAG: hypothetical protein US90_C0005G0003 [Candidatus Shapirobacteria bacterium GW2011_GWE2_38_30]|uniref:Gluconeogenesis factor n=3 Tax=Patescibacteria group TaxID=1783273 RepID=A0A0G0MAK8_9BACT|nr:MAG: hypothetical protein US90_C0005G0003 [Candidatus Shapirobacteria bacterium GW2011_GWE2_38_30]